MILDAQLSFCDLQAVTAAAVSTNTVDLGPVKGGFRDIGVGERLFTFVNVTTALTDAGSNTGVVVTMQGDTTAAFGSPVSDTLFTIPKNAAAGSIYYASLTPGMLSLQKQFLRLNFAPAGASLTGGAFSAKIVYNEQFYINYKDAIINIG